MADAERARAAAEVQMREQYARALNLADTVWRSETDGVLNQDRLRYLQAQYVGVVMADAVAQAVQERDAALIQVTDERDEMVRLNEGQRLRIDEFTAEVAEIAGLKHTLALWNQECGGRSPRELVEEIARLRAALEELKPFVAKWPQCLHTRDTRPGLWKATEIISEALRRKPNDAQLCPARDGRVVR